MSALFFDQSEPAIRESLRRAKRERKNEQRGNFDTAIDYFEDRMNEDTRRLLLETYESSMRLGGRFEEIRPVTIALLKKYVHEHASLYGRPVKRTIVNRQTREKNEELTKRFNEHLDGAGFDELMHAVEQRRVLLKSCGVWFQSKRGKLRPVITLPQHIYPILGGEQGDNPHIDPTDQHDYDAFAIELFTNAEDVTQASQRQWALVGKDATRWYQGSDVDEMRAIGGEWANPYRWLLPDDSGKLVEQPINPMVITHLEKSSELLPDHDVVPLKANQEVNVYYSTVFDVMRFQGYAVPFISGLEGEAQANLPHGVRFPRVLGVNETLGYANPGISFGDLMESIQAFVRASMTMLRDSPNEYAISETARPLSGFAKLVDSLPKLQARAERRERAKRSEEEDMYPVIAAILETIDPSMRALREHDLVVEYSDIEFPETVDERNNRERHDIEMGLMSRAQILARRTGMTEEEAEERISDNVGELPGADDEQQQGGKGDDSGGEQEHGDDLKPETEDAVDPQTALNGAQVTAMVDVVQAVAERRLPRETGVAMLVASFPIDEPDAEKIMGETGRTFFVQEEPKGPPPQFQKGGEQQGNQEPEKPNEAQQGSGDNQGQGEQGNSRLRDIIKRRS